MTPLTKRGRVGQRRERARVPTQPACERAPEREGHRAVPVLAGGQGSCKACESGSV
jgi:hypothetical protein